VSELFSTLSGFHGTNRKKEVWALLDAQQTNPITRRMYWQHPVRKWNISVIIKRGIVEGERRRIIHIDYHDDISEG
jgi:hypothetical protein